MEDLPRPVDPAFAEVLTALGRPGSIHLLPTPALRCDLTLLEGNIAAMQALCDDAGIRLRPHAKSHKSALIARLQLERGAPGICCAKLSEAESLVRGLAAGGRPGPESVLLTSPVTGAASARRIAALAAACDLAVVVDHPDAVDELARAVDAGGGRLTVLCDVDVGLGRTGVVGPTQAVAVARRVSAHRVLGFGGVQGYAGHVQHIGDRDDRRRAASLAADRLTTVVDALEADGHDVATRTGGGTGTSLLDAELGGITELQVGSYVFMDREYRDALGDDPEGRFAQSLTIATTVVSANQAGFVTVDAGLKAMATDAGPPAVIGHDAAHYAFFGDEHGLVTAPDPLRLTRGDRLALIPPHCDPTVDRYDRIWLTRGDSVVGVTAVTARGRSY